jgi:hypothetical protein
VGGLRAALHRARELDQLIDEAWDARQQHVVDACARVRTSVLIGLPLNSEDCGVVQQFIGRRTMQDRYGR